MIPALVRAVGQLSDPPVRKVVWLSVLGAILGFLTMAGLVWILLFQTRLTELPWLDTTIDVLGGLGVFALAYLFFPAVVVTISGLLLERVAVSVERRHYPGLPPAEGQSLGAEIWNAVKFLALVVFLNLLVLPAYLFPGINIAVFYILNGYLLSREYFELVALRRMTPAAARTMRKAHSAKLFLAGVIVAFFSTIPFVNLLVPVVATAFMVHIFYGLTGNLHRAAR
ncbi:EI24 domain-containing protein [Skermanella sp. TT6]|uniref:EI24 domain-containing protein n=1 Tax=Skermanella cutis TaxID=2775420 RepID=A0ABX7B5I6_9PROT|nr:EI24 domain-containing protein [Skermanella sp. TT6]QQP89427.1 EI24 domain-containing protein [Skermanella sp. TT6]